MSRVTRQGAAMMPLKLDSSDPAVRDPREELLLRGLPALRRWAHRRLPPSARDEMDTCDLVQETALRTLRCLASFTPEHAGSMPAYLHRAAGSIVIDAVRRAQRRPVAPLEQAGPLRSCEDDPLSEAIRSEARARYRTALLALRARDRRLLIARHHLEWRNDAIARRLGLPSADAVRMALRRAERRLQAQLARDAGGAAPGSAGTGRRTAESCAAPPRGRRRRRRCSRSSAGGSSRG